MLQSCEEVLNEPQAHVDVSEVPLDPRPVIKWSNVSKFKIRDVPEPQLYPIFGCSDDQSLYDIIWEDRDCRGSHFTTKTSPFGSMPGYLTDKGVVKVTDKVHSIHRSRLIFAYY